MRSWADIQCPPRWGNIVPAVVVEWPISISSYRSPLFRKHVSGTEIQRYVMRVIEQLIIVHWI